MKTKYKSLVGAFGYPEGVEIFYVGPCAYNTNLVMFQWPKNSGCMWLEKHEYEEKKTIK